MTHRRIALAASIALVLVLAVVPAALAGEGAKRPGGSRATGAKIAFDPASVVVGQQYRVNGSGFRANTWVTVGAHFPDTTWWSSGITDSQGKFSFVFTATSAGRIYHEAKQQSKGGRLRLMATGYLTAS